MMGGKNMIGRKIIVLAVTLLICLSTFRILNDNKEVVASGGGGEGGEYTPIIAYSWVYGRTKELSDIININDDYYKGRDFGEIGEREAKDKILGWMGDGDNSIDLPIVHQPERISKRWTGWDWNFWIDNYMGLLAKKRIPIEQDCWIHVTVKDKYDNNKVVYEKTFSVDDRTCFPFLKAPTSYASFGELYSCCNMKVVNNFEKGTIQPQCLLIKTSWENPSSAFTYIRNQLHYHRLRIQAFLVYDCWDDTYFMYPSYADHGHRNGSWVKPGFSIKGSEGDEIQNYTDNPARYDVTADMKSHWYYDWNVESYNVIGEIPGGSSDKVNIVCAHYDCWWNQGTIDEAAETALVLGIAKYMKENNIQPRYDTKFIAFAGEEHGFRGSKDYIKRHYDEENYSWIINPGNFGFAVEDSIFTFNSDNTTGSSTATNVANALKYTMITEYGTTQKSNPGGSGEDGAVFKNNYHTTPDGIIVFSRGHFEGYHRDDFTTHTQGDTMSSLDNKSFSVECDTVLLTTLHLIVDSKLQFQDCSITKYDSGNDGKNDSVSVSFEIECNRNMPAAGNVNIRIVDKSNNNTMCSSETGFQLINKGETKSGYINLTLRSDHPGLYDAQVRLINATGDNSSYDDYYNETFYLNLYDYPIADFTYSPREPTDIENVTFTDHSYPSDGPNPQITSWHWDFDDGHTSNEQNPEHKFDDDGYYYVNLTVWDNNNKTNSTNKTIYVKNVPPTTNITVEPIINTVNSTIWFNSTVYEPDGYIINWTWDFKDGNYSYQQNTTHVYQKSGIYNVKLTVTDDDNATGSANKIIYVYDALVNNSWEEDDPPHHKWNTIQEGIDDVENDEMIFVFKGTYDEMVTIEGKSIKIYGEDREQTIINGEETVVDIIDSTVYLECFTVKNGLTGIKFTGGIGNEINNCIIQNTQIYGLNFDESLSNYVHQCDITGSETGVNIINGSDYTTISQSNISSASYGIYIQDSSYNYIGSLLPIANEGLAESNWLYFNNNCRFDHNIYSIYISESEKNIIGSCYINATTFSSQGNPVYTTGINLDNSMGNRIAGCQIYNANEYGIYMASSDDNNITYCNITENNIGILMSSCCNNFIDYNKFINNSEKGLHISQTSSKLNYVYLNDFINNGGGTGTPVQARDDGRDNIWYKCINPYFCAADGEGNYWSDYTGVDENRDGVGDTPYNISGTAQSEDIYPLMDILWT